ncbi:MAG: hypothetical protein N2114_05005 [Candidatus Goldbacteria bacterium]|nr:hypothetical protein [Candidatus Goldiibacteriota bacterium]
MRKIFLILLFLCLSFCVFAEVNESFSKFYETRDLARKLLNEKKYEEASAKYLEAEKLAFELKDNDGGEYAGKQAIADWQRNNAGYSLILAYLETKDKKYLIEAKEILTFRIIATEAKTKVDKNLAFIKEHLK